MNADKSHLRYVSGKGYQVQVWVPDELRERVGQLAGKAASVKQLTQYIGLKEPRPSYDATGRIVYPPAAKREALPVVAKFNGWLETAKAGRPVLTFDLRDAERYVFRGGEYTATLTAKRTQLLPASTPGMHHVGGDIYVIDGEPVETRVSAVVDSETFIQKWAESQKTRPAIKAIRRKRAVVAQLFDFLGIEVARELIDKEDGKTYRAFDLMRVDDKALQRFKESIPVAQQCDVLSHIKALYKTAQREQKFTDATSPARHLYIPPKPEPEDSWEPFTEREADDLVAAALAHDNPAVKFTQILSAMLGTITSEISRRTVADFKIDGHGNHYLDIPKGKTDSRPRKLPLRWDVLSRVGFVAYLEQRAMLGPQTRLFDISPENTANRNNTFLRGLIADRNKQSNGWRKRFINALLNLKQNHPEIDCDGDRRRYLAGHTGQDVHADRYLKHPIHETKPILDLLRLPALLLIG